MSQFDQPFKHLVIYTDGGARGNPGPAAIGFVIRSTTGKSIHQTGCYIGEATNNVAEYQGVIHALDWISHHLSLASKSQLDFFLDSNLVVNQLSGNFKIKNSHLRELFTQTQLLINKLNVHISFSHVPREQNTEADALLNQALDQHLLQ